MPTPVSTVTKTVPVEELVAHALTSLRDGRRTLRAAALTLLTCAIEELRAEPGLCALSLRAGRPGDPPPEGRGMTVEAMIDAMLASGEKLIRIERNPPGSIKGMYRVWVGVESYDAASPREGLEMWIDWRRSQNKRLEAALAGQE